MLDQDQLHEDVRARYAEAALVVGRRGGSDASASCCGPDGSPRFGEPGVRFTTQRLEGLALVQSSSLAQEAQSEPSVARLQARLGRSQTEPRPHSRCTAAGSVESQ